VVVKIAKVFSLQSVPTSKGALKAMFYINIFNFFLIELSKVSEYSNIIFKTD
jgi:hypothetical protein